MCKKLLSAFGVILIFTFCSVKPGPLLEKFKKAFKDVGKSLKGQVKDTFNVKKKIGKSVEAAKGAGKSIKEGAEALEGGIKGQIEKQHGGKGENKEKEKSPKSEEKGVEKEQKIEKESREEVQKEIEEVKKEIGTERIGAEQQKTATERVIQAEYESEQRKEKEAVQEAFEAEQRKKVEAESKQKEQIEAEAKKKTKLKVEGESQEKYFIPVDQIVDGKYTTPSGKVIEVEPGEKFVEVDGKYLRVGEIPEKQPKSVIEEKKGFLQSFKEKMGDFFEKKPKTPEEQAKKELVKFLFEKQQLEKGQEPAGDKGPMDELFMKIGLKVAYAFPDTSIKLMKTSLKMHDTKFHKWNNEVNDESREWGAKLKKSLGLTGKKYIKDSEIDALIKEQQEEALRCFRESISEENKQRLARGEKEMTDKDISEREKDIKDFHGSSEHKANVRRQLENDKVMELAEEKVAMLKETDPEKYTEKLAEIAKKTGLKPTVVERVLHPTVSSKKLEELEKILSTKGDEGTEEAERKKVLEASYLEEVRGNLRQNWIDRCRNFGQSSRESAQRLSVLGIAMVSSLVLSKIIGQIQNKVVGEIRASAEKEDLLRKSKKENLEASYIRMKKERERLAAKARLDQASIAASPGVKVKADEDPEAKIQADMLDGATKVVNFYLTFDDFFKNVLDNFGYYDRTLNTTAKLKYSGGVLNVGMALLFNYSGTGNIANGLTPVNTKIYPTIISGKTISFDSILDAVNDALSMELMSAISKGLPEPIFMIKAISLFNTANKKFNNPEQRNEFLEDELYKLFIRLSWTVDEIATSRSNALEPDLNKWESIYIKDVSKCLFGGPEVLRNIMKPMIVTGVKNSDGSISDIPYEQFLIDRFEDFKILKSIPFEGDLGFIADNDKFDSRDISLAMFSIFLRGLNDILRLEKDLAKKTEPTKMRYATGNEESIVGKNVYEQITKSAFEKFNQAQDKFICTAVDLGFAPEDKGLLAAYQKNEKEYLDAAYQYDAAALNFRKKVCSYIFDRTQGIEPETVFDFISREVKRYYRAAKNKKAVETDLPKVFAPFAPNFPFSAEDILVYAKDPGPIKSPSPKIIDLRTDVPKESNIAVVKPKN